MASPCTEETPALHSGCQGHSRSVPRPPLTPLPARPPGLQLLWVSFCFSSSFSSWGFMVALPPSGIFCLHTSSSWQHLNPYHIPYYTAGPWRVPAPLHHRGGGAWTAQPPIEDTQTRHSLSLMRGPRQLNTHPASPRYCKRSFNIYKGPHSCLAGSSFGEGDAALASIRKQLLCLGIPYSATSGEGQAHLPRRKPKSQKGRSEALAPAPGAAGLAGT